MCEKNALTDAATLTQARTSNAHTHARADATSAHTEETTEGTQTGGDKPTAVSPASIDACREHRARETQGSDDGEGTRAEGKRR